jgi:hypothetical protein
MCQQPRRAAAPPTGQAAPGPPDERVPPDGRAPRHPARQAAVPLGEPVQLSARAAVRRDGRNPVPLDGLATKQARRAGQAGPTMAQPLGWRRAGGQRRTDRARA